MGECLQQVRSEGFGGRVVFRGYLGLFEGVWGCLRVFLECLKV